MNGFIRSIALAGTLLAAAGSSGAATIVNGGFEDHPATGNWDVFASIPGWTTTSGAGIEIQTNVTLGMIDAHGGLSYVELDSHGNSTMQQVLAFTETGPYELSFWYSPRRDLAASNTIAYFLGDNMLGSVTGPDGVATFVGDWTRITTRFMIEAVGDYTLRFAATGTDDSYGGLIDDIAIAAVPLPAGGLLLLTALGGLVLVRRKRMI